MNKVILSIFKYKITRYRLCLVISVVNIGLILLSNRTYISREINECASTDVLLKSYIVKLVCLAFGNFHFAKTKYTEN